MAQAQRDTDKYSTGRHYFQFLFLDAKTYSYYLFYFAIVLFCDCEYFLN